MRRRGRVAGLTIGLIIIPTGGQSNDDGRGKAISPPLDPTFETRFSSLLLTMIMDQF